MINTNDMSSDELTRFIQRKYTTPYKGKFSEQVFEELKYIIDSRDITVIAKALDSLPQNLLTVPPHYSGNPLVNDGESWND